MVGWRSSKGAAAARPILTRDWGGPRVKDPIPIVSVNPTEDRPRPQGAEGRKGPKRRKAAGGGGGGRALKGPRCDSNPLTKEGCETEVTLTSERHAQEEWTKK